MRSALLLAVALAGCNLTYDREGLKYEPPPSVETCTAAGQVFCTLGTRDFCADLTADPLNCGSCGHLCGVGVGCTSGVCNGSVGDCGDPGTGSLACGTTEHPYCGCGTCDTTSCPAGEACVAGSCQPPAVTCTLPKISCDLGAGPYCADLATDAANCGACGNACGASVTCTGSLCGGLLPAVEPFLPTNGANWNDWVKGNDPTDATDAACDPGASGSACVHAGEMRRVRVANRTDCTGLTALDKLGAFTWTCVIGTDGKPWMVSERLRGAVDKAQPEARLATLIDFSSMAWKANGVTVYQGGVKVADTPETAWWSNPIKAVPASGQLAPSTSGAGPIYVSLGGEVPSRLDITGSKVALSILPGAKLSVPATTTLVVVQISGYTFPRDFLWVEGAIDATNANVGLQASAVRRSTFRSIDVTRAAPDVAPTSYGLAFFGGDSNRVRRIHAAGHEVGILFDGTIGFDIQNVEASACLTGIRVVGGAVDNVFRGAAVAVNRADGFLVDTSPDNLLDGVVASNNAGVGIRVFSSNRTRIVDSVAVYNAADGILFDNAPDARVVAVTTEGNGVGGVHFANSSHNPVVLGLTAHLDGVGLWFTGSSGGHVADVALEALPGLAALRADPTSSNTFLGTLLIGGTSLCDAGSSGAGFTGACGPSGTSTHILQTSPIGFAPSFISPTTILSDSMNGSYSGAPVTITSLDAPFDWTSFQNGYRAWAGAGGTRIGCQIDPNVREAPACAGAWTGTLEVRDWSLKFTDAVLRDRLGVPTPAIALTHSWFTGAASTFLMHAYELSGYLGGDRDALCEAYDTCLYAPNYGAYQGHGALDFVGDIDPMIVGAPAHVFRYAPATNGY